MNTSEIRSKLYTLQDRGYAAFQAKLIPTMDPSRIIGVRTPALRALAKRLRKEEDLTGFLTALPHEFFDEDQLHAFVISLEKDFDTCIAQVDRFLPHIDNWATCDQMSPKIFAKHKAALLPHIDSWLASSHTYTVRFAIGMLMQHYLDDDYKPEYPERVAAIRSDEYYINMMIAWYFATALAKQYDAVLPFLTEKRLPVWTHNKTIQKAVESFRITPECKAYLKALRTTG